MGLGNEAVGDSVLKDEFILGPPGTGKTSTLIKRIEDALHQGVDPERLALITFTKSAANVAVERVQEAFPGAKFPYVRTLHSMAFAELGMKKSQVISDYKEIAEAIHLPLRRTSLHPPKDGDLIFQVLHLAYTLDVSLAEALNRCGYDVDFKMVELAHAALADYKKQTGKWDFVDMLKKFKTDCVVPPIDLLLVDEAQDLSRVQWNIVDMFKCPKILAGDDDQTIYAWAGADVKEYIRRIDAGEKTILSQSFRLPLNIWTAANELIGKVATRVEKDWHPRKEPGTFTKVPQDFKPTFQRKGTYLVLGLFQYQLGPIAAHLRKLGKWFEYPDGRTSIPPRVLSAHKAWEKWRLSGVRDTDLAVKCRPFLNSYAIDNHLLDSHRPIGPLMGCAGGVLTDKERVYLQRALVDNRTEPRVRLSTIHRAKGDEADHVFLMNPTSKRTRQLFHGPRDDLTRLLYVGMTRAKETLHVTRGGELV